MQRRLGPRCHPVYEAIRSQLIDGSWPSGSRLPSHAEMAAEFGVSIMTLRQALLQLSEEGLVSLDHGRGTFVRTPESPTVLIVDDDPTARFLLRQVVESKGYRLIEADNPADALRGLEREPSTALVMSDVRMPTAESGVEFIRTVRRRWPALAVAAVTAYPSDLAVLHRAPESPVLVISKPFFQAQIEELLSLVLGAPARPRRPAAWPPRWTPQARAQAADPVAPRRPSGFGG